MDAKEKTSCASCSLHSLVQLAACCMMLFMRPLGYGVIGMFIVEFYEYFHLSSMEQLSWLTVCHLGVTVLVSCM